jgi:16S rRNA (cytidine1402-2'-O)-methyltransferase
MATVFLIPVHLHEEAPDFATPPLLDALRQCTVFFVENERTARRFFKRIWKEMVIDDYAWHSIHKQEEELVPLFRQSLKEGKTVGIVSEAGCPGIADPGQVLVSVAHKEGAVVKPLTGPNAILLALMASGLNGQQFRFCGYLPIDTREREKHIRELEQESAKKQCTQIFIETPYRNQAFADAILRVCQNSTRLCIAEALTAPHERIRTSTIGDWKKNKPVLAKEPMIFLLLAG